MKRYMIRYWKPDPLSQGFDKLDDFGHRANSIEDMLRSFYYHVGEKTKIASIYIEL